MNDLDAQVRSAPVNDRLDRFEDIEIVPFRIELDVAEAINQVGVVGG